MSELARVHTPLSDLEAAGPLLDALRVAGVQPHREQARLLLAQLRFEGLGSCNNHNVGNISARDTGSADFFRPVWFDVDPTDPNADPHLVKLHEAMQRNEAPRAFRSYPDFTAGFADYVHQLVSRFPSILAAAATGDAQATATAIKTSGYTPDAPSSLGSTLAKIVAEFESRGLYAELPLAPSSSSPPAKPPPAAGSSSRSSSSPPSLSPVPADVVEEASVCIWRASDGTRGFTLTIGESQHAGKLRDLPDWLGELGLLDRGAA